MARYTKGINGPFRGKAGSVVGCKWREIDYLRSLPRKSNKPATQKKATSQDVFRFINRWLNAIDGLVNIGFDKVHPNRTGRMSAFSYNSLNALMGGYPNKVIDYSKARFSMGDLPQSPQAGIKMLNDDTLLIHWDPRCESERAKGSDVLMFFIYCPEIESAETQIGAKLRADASLEIVLPNEYRNKRIEVQIAFKSLISNEVSTSQYAGGLFFGKEENAALAATPASASSFCIPISVGSLLRQMQA